MDPSKLPGARIITPILWAILAGGLMLSVALHIWRSQAKPSANEKVTLSILRSEVLTFLVTRRTATQIVIDYGESDWAGEWRGVYWCTVSWRWGVDLQKITEADIRRDGDAVIVHLPEPELLDFALVPGSVGFMSKSTAVPKALDLARGGSQRQLLEQKVQEQALKFASDQKLLPSRQEIVKQLNESAGMIGSAAGVKVRFE